MGKTANRLIWPKLSGWWPRWLRPCRRLSPALLASAEKKARMAKLLTLISSRILLMRLLASSLYRSAASPDPKGHAEKRAILERASKVTREIQASAAPKARQARLPA